MLIGVLSDTHDNLEKIKKAVDLFNREKVDFVLHAGDYVAPFSLSGFKGLKSGWKGVFGNNDGERAGLSKSSAGAIHNGPLRIKLQQRKITLVHDINSINVDKEPADLIIFGHTHKPQIIRRHDKLLVNPGEACGWLSGVSTAAIVDLSDLSIKTFNI